MAFSLPSLTFQLFVDGAWTTYPASWSEGWSIRTGPDPDTGLTPNKIELTLVNDDLSMDPSNVTSPLYGKIGQNTPCRLLDSGFTLTRAEASDWQPDSTVEHSVSTGKGRAWVTLTAEGLLRRLGKWEDPLDSPMTRQTNSYASLIGHSPLEDPSGAASLSNAVPGVRSGYYRGTVSLAGNTGAGGSGPCMQMGSDGFIAGYFSAPAGSGYQICFAAKLSASPSSATYQTILQWGDTLGRTWAWQVNNSAYQIVITDQDGATIDTTAFTYGSAPPNQWIRYRMKVTVSGSTLTYEPATYVQDRSFATGVTDTFTSSATGRPRSWTASGNTWTDGAAYTNVFAVTDTSLDLLTGNAAAAFDGYLGERAGQRFARLISELSLQAYLDGDADLSAPMGRQKPGRALDLLDECARTDGGLLFDEVLDIALTLRLHNALINQTVTLALTKGTNIAPPLRKQIGDAGTANDIAITNWDGTEIRLEQETGPKSVQPPPAGVGRYKLPLAVNVRDSDNQLFWRGNWELANGTLRRPRYRQVTINLVANPSLRSTITTMRSGHLVSLTGVEPDVIYLRVISIERSGSDTTDVATLNCLPADVWLTGEYDDTSYRYDSRTTTLGVGVNATATPLAFSFTVPGDYWSIKAGAYDVLVAGERFSVAWMSSVGSIAALDGGFETGLAGWTPNGFTGVQSSSFAHVGTYSAQLTVTGSPSTASIFPATQWPVTVGASYTATCRVYATSSISNVRISISWYTNLGAFVSSSLGSTVALGAGVWTQLTVQATAPATGVLARPIPQIFGSPANGTVMYCDDVDMVADAAGLTSAGPYVQLGFGARSANGVVKALGVGEEIHVFRPARYAMGGI